MSLRGDSALGFGPGVANLRLMLSTEYSQIGTGSSNSPRCHENIASGSCRFGQWHEIGLEAEVSKLVGIVSDRDLRQHTDALAGSRLMAR